MKIIDGKKLAQEILDDVKVKIVSALIKPRLAIVFVGNNPASEVYVQKKYEAGTYAGITVDIHRFETIQRHDLITLLDNLSADKAVHGIILQLPVEIDDIYSVLSHITTEKDVDGLNAASLGSLWQNPDYFLQPATPRAILRAIDSATDLSSNFLAGKHALVINNSLIIGKPLAAMLLARGATVTIAHSQTVDLPFLCRNADVLVSGTGQKGLIKGNMLKTGAIVIDSGFSKFGGKIYGDVDNESCQGINCTISPVPGGIGPLGVAMLIENTFIAAQRLTAL